MDFTIIVPVYNAESYLEEALISFENQKDQDFKVVIINDGSTDDTEKIVHKFIQRGTINISYYAQSNQGVSAARNEALRHIDTKYIMFCDADDIYSPYMISMMHEMIKVADVALCRVTHDMRENNDKQEIQSSFIKTSIYNVLNSFLYENNQYSFASFCYRADIVLSNNLTFSQDLKYGEDEEFTWKYLLFCESACVTRARLYRYRNNQQSATKQVSYQRTQVIDSMARICCFYRQYDSPFANQLETYGLPRAKLAILTEFAKNNNYDLFLRLCSSEKYNYRMLKVTTAHDIKVKIATIVFIISKTIFFKLIRLIS